ncbi:Cache domain-containing protein, partial [Formivibrio citricus]
MRLSTRIWIMVAASLLGLLVMAVDGLYQMRQSLLEERRAQIAQLLDFADAQLKYFHGQETSGKLSREEAQARAKESIAAQKKGSDYFFIRSLKEDMFVLHPIPSRVGVKDDGGKMPDGRSTAQAYRDSLAQSKDNKAFFSIMAPKPGDKDKDARYPKLNGVLKFEPWGWMPGIGFFTDDIEQTFWKRAAAFLGMGAVLLAVVAFLAIRTMRSILGQLGGEPQYAAEIAQGIANGDLSRSIDAHGKADSLLGSMRVMQQGLHDIVARFNQASTTLATASQQLTEETEQISRGSQQTSEATASTAAAVEQMTVSISHISSSARETESNSRQAAELATH